MVGGRGGGRYKVIPCMVCAKPLRVGAQQRKPKRCLECGVKAMFDNARSLHAKEGPEYERWLAGCMRTRFEGGTGEGVQVESKVDDSTSSPGNL